MEVDYIILGQGIAGTLLSRNLIKEGKTFVLIDDGNPASSSLTCGGIINPVTGKRLVRSWMIDQLLPFAIDTYSEMEKELGVQLIKRGDILEFYSNPDLKTAFEDKIIEESDHLYKVEQEEKWHECFRFNYGIGGIKKSLILDTATMISQWRAVLNQSGSLLKEEFDWDNLKIAGGEVFYKDITAKKIVFCEGPGGDENPYFKMLPWSKDKGEALIAAIPGLPETHIFKQSISIVPKGNGVFWIGATHDWKYTDMNPTPGFRKMVEEQLDYWLKLPYRILDHVVARRPANFERKPFVGLHPTYPEVAILNGFGGKGCSFAPFFASQLTDHLAHGTTILPEADVSRFSKVLQRSVVNHSANEQSSDFK